MSNASQTLDTPLTDDALVEAFRASLADAKRNGVALSIKRAGNDYEVYFWIDDRWKCFSVGRDSGGGCASTSRSIGR